MLRPILILALGYLLGSIPFSYLVARAFGVGDVRKVGSGNVGATNVMRTAGKAAGILALVLDASKGGAATWAAGLLDPGVEATPALAAVAAVLGHIFPVWLRFQGGKGVATGAGAFFPLAPAAAALSVVVFAAALATSRYVSVSSIVAAASLPILAAAMGAPRAVFLCAALSAGMIIFKHRTNMARLRAGTENRLGGKA
jgi:glycerol-3-phosphate acyltransferase PlsY